MILPEYHRPVLLEHILSFLQVKPGGKYIDATLGGGGVSREILKKGAVVLGIDQDDDAINFVKKESLKWHKDNGDQINLGRDLIIVKGNFAQIRTIAESHGFCDVSGIIFDLGMSFYQITGSGKGFSYLTDEPLDMRMDISGEVRAEDIINTYTEEQLDEIFSKYSEELNSRSIARAIVRARSLKGRIKTTGQLKEIINNKATLSRIFQAIRIEVNNELNNLKQGLGESIGILNSGGLIIVISFHSLEDRIVKLQMRLWQGSNIAQIINKNPIMADKLERRRNPSSRSAKLRVVQKK